MKDSRRPLIPVFSALFLVLTASAARADGTPEAAAREGVLAALSSMGSDVYGCTDRKRGMTVGLVHADSRGIHTIVEKEDEGAAMMFNFGVGPSTFEGYLVQKVSLDRKDPNYLVFSLGSTSGGPKRTLWLNTANPRSSAYTVPSKRGTFIARLECSIARPAKDGSWRLPDFESASNNQVSASSDARSSERPFSERLRESMLRWDARSRASHADSGM